MTCRSLLTVTAVIWLLGFGTAHAQQVRSADVEQFLGTWTFAMTNPAGSTEIVRVFDRDGRAAATVQSGRMPAHDITGLVRDGDMLVLTVTRVENGKPDRAVIALMPDGGGMKMEEMLEFSQTIKRGVAAKRE